jgi:mono/diheme cytochrome c family protein
MTRAILLRPSALSAALLATVASLPIYAAGSADAGASAWVRSHPQADGSPARSCASCHGQDLTQPGRHAKTGKHIEAMAPSVNAQRLTDPAKVEKWLRRNCRWTLGRECTAEEKADFLAYIATQ